MEDGTTTPLRRSSPVQQQHGVSPTNSSHRHHHHSTQAVTGRRPRGIFVELLEQNHVFGRVARLGQHIPILYVLCGTIAGVVAFPFIVFLCLLCGSVGFGLLLLILLQGGFFAMAVLSLLSSLVLPFLAALPFAALSYVTYRSSDCLKSFMWTHFNGPMRKCYTMKRRIENAIAALRGEPIHVDYPRSPHNQDISYGNHYSHDYGEEDDEDEVVIDYYRREQNPQPITGEWQDIRRRFSRGVPLHNDLSDHTGIAEGSCLYMADFINNILMMAFFFTLVYLFSQAVSGPPPQVYVY